MQPYQTQPDERPDLPETSAAVRTFLESEALGSFPISAYANPGGFLGMIDTDAYLFDARTPGNYHLSVLPDLGVLDGVLTLETVVGVSLYEIWWDGTASAPTRYYLSWVDGAEIKTDTIALGLAAQAGWGVVTDPTFVDINLRSEGARALNQNQYASGMFVIDIGAGAVDYTVSDSSLSQSHAGRYLLTQDNPTGQRNSMWGPLWIDRIQRIDTSNPVTDWATSVDVDAVSVVVPEALRPFTPDWGSPGQITTFSFEVDNSQVFADDDGHFLADNRDRFNDLVALVIKPGLTDKVIGLYAGGPLAADALTRLDAARNTVEFTSGFRERVKKVMDRLFDAADDMPGADAEVGDLTDYLRDWVKDSIGSDAASKFNGMSVGLGETQSSAFSFGFGSLRGYVHRDVLVGSDGPDTLDGNDGDDSISGGAGNDTIVGGNGNDTIKGGTGVDSAVFQLPRAHYTVTSTGQGAYTVAALSGAEGTDTLVDIERLQFSDINVALDTRADQSTGLTVLLLGATLPGQLVFDTSKQQLLGAVIDLFDEGYSLRDLSGAVLRLPIWDVLTGLAAPTNRDIANYLLANVNGSAPEQSVLDAATNALNTESFQGDWFAGLAGSAANQMHVGLVGLMDTGLEFLSPGS